MHKLGWIVAAALSWLALAGSDSASAADATASKLAVNQAVGPKGLGFEKDIRPIFRAHCLDCHGSQNVRKGGLDLRLRRLMVKGGESGPAIIPGQPTDSYLVDRIKGGEMPPGDTKLSAKEIATIEAWIAAGAPTAHAEPADVNPANLITEDDRAFWSFRPIRRPPLPVFAAADRVRSPIDALLLDAMHGKHLSFSPDADRRTLIRRVTLDLTGLAPEPAEVAAFVADTSADAYERLLDRLLESPHYGERWGRHWLDVAGYADSEGYDDRDVGRPEAFRYRDYVIQSFNANKPFDQFVTEQIAGDELVPPPYKNLSAEAIEKLTATGYLRMAADGTATAGANLPTASNQVVTDTIKIVSTSLLGLSVGCAQCHDHRYDPILQDDYYRLRAVFEPALNWKNWRVPTQRRISLYTDADRAKVAKIEAEAGKAYAVHAEKMQKYIARALDKQLTQFDPKLAKQLKAAFDTPAGKRTAEQKSLLDNNPSVNITEGTLYQYDPQAADDLKKDVAQIAAIRARIPPEEFLRVLNENPGEIPATFLFYRGEYQQPKHEVAPGDLTVCVPVGENGGIAKDDATLPTTGRRLAYARRLLSGKHPLVGRVLVNRIWLHHFGRGLVGTPGDFGHMGESPTNSKLLDWLADEFAASGWNLKRLHRLIVMSTAYRQSSVRTPDRDAVDPDNLLLSRMNIHRLDAEIIRDRVLEISGSGFDRMYGKPVPVKEDAVGQIVVGIDNKVGANEPGADIPIGPEQFRRSVYIEVRRSRPLAVLRTFDAPVMETNCDRRIASTAAPQALLMMNSDFALTQSNVFAQRLRRETGAEARRQIQLAFELAFNRPADQTEVERSLAFLDSQTDELQDSASAASSSKMSQAALASKQNSASKQKKKRRKYETMQRSTAAERGLQPLADFCQAILSSNEFLYVD